MEPLAGHNVLSQLLANQATATVLLNTTVTQVTMNGNAIVSVAAADSSGATTEYLATYFLDATDMGDLLASGWRAGCRLGDGYRKPTRSGWYGEPLAQHRSLQPEWIQPITLPFALERRPMGENNTIPEPPNYAQLKSNQGYTIDDGDISTMFTTADSMWSYRSVIAAANFNDPAFPYDLTMINTGSNDYQTASIPTGNPVQDAANRR